MHATTCQVFAYSYDWGAFSLTPSVCACCTFVPAGQTSSPSPDGQLLDSKSCKSYHRLTLILSLIAAMLSMAALAITLLVFLGVLSTGRDDCMCTMNQGMCIQCCRNQGRGRQREWKTFRWRKCQRRFDFPTIVFLSASRDENHSP